MKKLSCCFVVASFALLSGPTLAHAQKPEPDTIVLRRAEGKTTVSKQPATIAVGATLKVSCEQFDCREVHARMDVGAAALSPGDTGSERIQQREFLIPESKPGSGVELRLCPLGTPAGTCEKAEVIVTIAVKGPESGGGAAAGGGRTRESLQFCTAIGVAQVRELFARRGREDFTVVLFDEAGPCYLSRQFGAEGDPIAIGFVSLPGPQVSLDLDPCNTLAAGPKVLVSADVSTLTIQSLTTGKFVAQWFPPVRRCFGTSAGIKLAVTMDPKAQPKAVAYTLKQFERYRATLQIGVLASDLHQQAFGLRPDGDVKRIIETSAEERGPEYVASVVLYSLPRYFARRSVQQACFFEEDLKKPVCAANALGSEREPYFGRDPVNENGVADRIGLLLGAGLNQPGRRFLAGLSFEVLTGVNLVVSREFVRLPELEGVALGDAFVGEAATIPARDHWRQAWTFGISIDARYALALFGRK